MAIDLRTLGTLDLHDTAGGNARAVLQQPKRFAILVYLATAKPGALHRRDTLLALFWPALDHERARSALRQSLHFLRHSMEGAIASRGEEEVGVWPERISCDAAVFQDHLDAGRAIDALALYRGDFLPGFHLSGCPDIERWIEDERDRLARKAADAAWTLVTRETGAGDLDAGVPWARRAVELRPNDEAGVARLIGLLDQVGDRAGSIATYEAFAHRLREDYESEPAPETRALISRVRARVTPSDPDALHSVSPGAAVTTEAPGRRRRLRRLLGAVSVALVLLTTWLGSQPRTASNSLGPPIAITFGNVPTDLVSSDWRGDPWGTYEDGACGVSATFNLHDMRFDPTAWSVRPDEERACGGRQPRLFTVSYVDRVPASPPGPQDGRTVIATFLKVNDVELTDRGIPVLQSAVIQAPGCANGLNFNPVKDPRSNLVKVTRNRNKTWTIETQPAPNDVAVCIPDASNPNAPPRSYYHMPFHVVIRAR